MAVSSLHTSGTGDDRVTQATRKLIALVRESLDGHFSIRLWDGSVEPLGQKVVPGLELIIHSPGVLPSILRRPSLERLIRHYANGRIDIAGGTFLDLFDPFALDNEPKRRLRRIPKAKLARALWPLLFASGDAPDASRAFADDETGARRKTEDNKKFIGFHYDVGNGFYELFLDDEMQYSCAHFPAWDADIHLAQRTKIDVTCRKLRLKPGETLLDIGCGWGGLLCHAVQKYGVIGHGITLSQEQLDYARAKAERLGIADRVTFELRDYAEVEGTFDKIVSVGMYEHIGLANIDGYFAKMRSLLADDGLFLNHAIARRAKPSKRRWFKRPEARAIQRYIFPGGDLDNIGHTVAAMEQARFEIHDVEGWRAHYERTTRLWCERLTANRAEAEALVGPETYRIWAAYLAGVSVCFRRGSFRLFQVVAGKHAKGRPPLPSTRADLYCEPFL